MKIRKLILSVVLSILIVAGIYGGCGGNSGNNGTVILDPQIVRTMFVGQESEVAFITIPFLKQNPEGLITNAAVDFNGDGVFASYGVNGGTQQEWIVQNALLFISDTEYTVYFTAVDPDLQPGDIVAVAISAGSNEVPAPWDGVIPGDASGLETTVTIGTFNMENLVDPAPGAVGAGATVAFAQAQPPGSFGDPVDTLFMGPEPVGEVFFRDGLPDIPQQKNTCVPHSVANSLSWLARKCEFTDRFTNFEEIIVTTLEDGTKIETRSPLSIDVNDPIGVNDIAITLLDTYDRIGGFFTLSDGGFGGIANEKILEGKELYTEDHDIPVESSLLLREEGEFTFETIKDFMRQGCDVELILRMLDIDTGSPSELGHAVTLAGYTENASGKSITIHDPGTPTTFNDVHQLTESEAGGLTFPYIFMDITRNALIDRILVECCITPPDDPGIPIPEPTPEPTPEPPDEMIAMFEVSQEAIEFLHMRNITPCPQQIAVIEVTNTGSQKSQFVVTRSSNFIDFRFEGDGPPSLSTLSFDLEPGESRSVVVFFNCTTTQSFQANVFIDGVLVDEGIGAVPGSGASETVPVSGTVR